MLINIYLFYLSENSLFNVLPITILLTSEVPAPISYNFASLSILPTSLSFIYLSNY